MKFSYADVDADTLGRVQLGNTVEENRERGKERDRPYGVVARHLPTQLFTFLRLSSRGKQC